MFITLFTLVNSEMCFDTVYKYEMLCWDIEYNDAETTSMYIYMH